MKNIKNADHFRKISRFCVTLILLSSFIVACEIAGDLEDILPDTTYPVSFTSYSITGPSYQGGDTYRDESGDDEFTTRGTLLKKEDDKELSHDQIQLSISKSSTESNFFVIAPPKVGSYSFSTQNDTSDFNIRLLLSSPEETYFVKNVSMNIMALEISGNTVTHCEGTYAGQFYRNNIDEEDVHQINGSFEINSTP